MRKLAIAVAAVVAITLVTWAGLRAYERINGGPPVLRFAIERLPTDPKDWRGRIDYRGLDRQFAALAQRPEMAGLAIAVVEDGRLSFVHTYGVADKSTGETVVPTTVFRWASLSKTAAGTFAGKLAAEGKVDLTAPLSKWRTTLRLPGGAEEKLTLDLVLSQRTGLTGHAYDERLEAGESPADLRRAFASAPMQCAPGACHTYQNIAFDVASEVLGQAAGEPFAQAVERQMFKPLGMASAKYGMAGLTGAKSWARPHRGSQVRTLSDVYWKVPAAAGVSSNVIDLARWMMAEMGEKPRVLSARALTIAHAPRVATARLYSGDLRAATSKAHYGLGWRSFDYAGHQLAGHSGAVDGYRATMIYEPATRTGVVALWNSDWGTPYRIPFAVLDSYFGTPDSRWLELPAPARPR